MTSDIYKSDLDSDAISEANQGMLANIHIDVNNRNSIPVHNTNRANDKSHTTNDSEDELIEIDPYEYDVAKMELSDEDRNDILRTGNGFLTEAERLSKLFAYIRTDRAYEFRKVLSEDRSVINTVHSKTYLLHEACRKGASEIVTFLLFSDARCNIKDGYGLMPQHYAVRSKSPTVLDILSVFGHDLNVRDSKQNTPLHHAVILKNRIMIHMLINYKVDPFAENNKKQQPTDLIDNDDDTANVIRNYIRGLKSLRMNKS